MKKHIFLFIGILLLLTSCETVNEKELLNLNGYWEIENVKAKGETFSPKGATTLVDYYFLEKTNKGFKKKLKPSLDQSYESSEDLTSFVIIKKEDGFYLQYNTKFDQWEEKVDAISPTKLVLNHQGKSYHYKRHTKLAF